MKEAKDQISGEYLSILISFTSGGGEASLQQGYELGRSALEARLGLLQVADAYAVALTELLKPISEEGARLIAATRELLSTSLAPFEMTHRGYQESIARLMRMNLALERRSAELAISNRELEAFSYTVSHDLRAPVRIMGGFAKTVLEDSGEVLDERSREHLARITDYAQRTGQLIEGLLSLSQYSRVEVTRSTVSLSGMAQSILQDLYNQNPSRQVEVSIAEGITAQGDAQLLHVVMSNLLANAWKYTAKTPQAKIEFGMTAKDGKSVYFIKDNGAGFDMKYADRLFGPFQRLHPSSQFEGNGV